jgi:hypothetical protein
MTAGAADDVSGLLFCFRKKYHVPHVLEAVHLICCKFCHFRQAIELKMMRNNLCCQHKSVF